MNYTREPIIETIISAKEGSRLVVRNSKRSSEEYFVDALEIVSFGSAVFYRSTERPKSFLLPITDYEVIELKETKMVLKSASPEQAIKIGGGKEETKITKRKKTHKKEVKPITQDIEKHITDKEKGGGQNDETQVSSSILRKLFPPPPNLIKERLNHIKSPEKIDESISKEIVKEDQKKEVEETIQTEKAQNIKEEPIEEEKVKEEIKEEIVNVEKIIEPASQEMPIEQRIEKEKKEE
jgi:hypothetical protein